MGLRWKLRELMQQRRVSNKQLADRLGVHRNTVLQLKEECPTMIRLEYLESLCLLLNCQPADLFDFCPAPAVTSATEARHRSVP